MRGMEVGQGRQESESYLGAPRLRKYWALFKMELNLFHHRLAVGTPSCWYTKLDPAASILQHKNVVHEVMHFQLVGLSRKAMVDHLII